MARLFNALVALGAGVSASSCGGEVGGTGRTGEGGTAGTGGTTAGTGSSTSSGGTTGGIFGGGGISFGGAATGGAGVGGAASLPDTGTLAQWNCTGLFDSCDSWDPEGDRQSLSTICPVDPLRPRSPLDCAPGTVFECTGARWADGVDIEVNCACSPVDASIGCNCLSPDGSVLPAQCTALTRVCFCAYTGILR